MDNRITYRIKHVGINNADEAEARRTVALLCALFGLEQAQETPVAYFVDELFEVMKNSDRGSRGHIAMQTEDVEAAMAELAARGATFDESTIRRDENGTINFIYLNGEIAGFQFHLTT